MRRLRSINRVLIMAMILTLIILVIPASVVMALTTTAEVENIEGGAATNPYYSEAAGEIGDTVRIYGEGVAGQELHICFSNQNAAIDDDIDDEVTSYEWLVDPIVSTITETYTASLVIPALLNDGDDVLEALYGGVYYFYITTGTSKNIIARAEFYVAGISIAEIDEAEGPVGTTVEISGEGFAPGEAIAVWFVNDDITDDYVLEGSIIVDANREFSILVEIPEEESGPHDLIVTGTESRSNIVFVFTVRPEITVTPYSAEAGSQVLIKGTGFDGRKYVNIYIGSTFITKTDLTDSRGSFSKSIVIPSNLPAGSFIIKAEDVVDDNISDTAQLTVEATQTTVIPTVTSTITIEPTTIISTIPGEPTTVTVTESSGVNVWIGLTSALGVITLVLAGFIFYIVRLRG